MPKLPINYDNTIIYRIVCKNPEIKDCYVGSTTDFKSRKRSHKSRCNCETANEYNFNVYQFIRSNGGWGNFDMIEIEKYKAIDKLDKLKRERYWLEFYSAKLNSTIPSRTIQEWNKNNYNENREEILKKKSELITCICGSITHKNNKSRHEQTNKHLKFSRSNEI